MRNHQIIFASMLLVLTACATAASNVETYDAEVHVDPRRGERVDRLCYGASIARFGESTKTSVVVSEGRDDYLIETFKGCFDLDSANSIAFRNRSSCLNRGDTFTPFTSAFGPDRTSFHPTPCRIKAIYEWNADALDDEDEAEAEVEE